MVNITTSNKNEQEDLHVFPKMTHLCVQDFGIGIPADKIPHVFDRFFRVPGDARETFPGLGLGLFISSEIVKRLNGIITVESRVGEGSTFCVSLPA